MTPAGATWRASFKRGCVEMKAAAPRRSPDGHAKRVIFSDAPVAESDEEEPGVILDYDQAGNFISRSVGYLDSSCTAELDRIPTLPRDL